MCLHQKEQRREEREKGDSDKNNKIIISLKIRSNKSSIEKLLNSQQNEIVLHQNNCTVHVNIQCKPQFSPEKFLELLFDRCNFWNYPFSMIQWRKSTDLFRCQPICIQVKHWYLAVLARIDGDINKQQLLRSQFIRKLAA